MPTICLAQEDHREVFTESLMVEAPQYQSQESGIVTNFIQRKVISGQTKMNAKTQLIVNGESGASNVVDQTGPSYDLLQNDLSGQGDFSFHLATADGDWFSLFPAISVTTGCRLFFLSRLGWATSGQVATVQVSTNAGASWNDTIWSQAGNGSSGETGFSLQMIDLDTYIGQDIQIRFIYAFTGGSFFPQVSQGVGWYIDNIQVGQTLQKELYTGFGNPSDLEQQFLEYINRSRASASAEALRLNAETDSDVQSAYASFGIQSANVVNQFSWSVSNGCMDEQAQPLAFQVDLLRMSELHTQDLFEQEFQGHVSSSSPPLPFQPGDTLTNRAARIGYVGNLGENVFSFGHSVAHVHAGFNADWGNHDDSGSACYNASFVGQGMQNPAGHRLALHNDEFREIGIGVIEGTNGAVGPLLVTQNLGSSGGQVITGVVYEDLNENVFYDPGEGVAGVQVNTENSAFFAETSASGGYALPIDGDGQHIVTFSGGGVAEYEMMVTTAGGKNSKLDYLVEENAGTFEEWSSGFGLTGGPNDDDDGDGMTNLMEYALAGFNPLQNDRHLLPQIDMMNGRAVYAVQKNTEAQSVTYEVESTTNLEHWNPENITILSETNSLLEVEVLPPLEHRVFVRVRITLEP